MEYYIIYPLAYLIGLLPYKIQFLVADIIRFLLHRVFRYRLSVVRTNLKNSFPEKSDKELREIEKRFYNHLSDVFLETISMASVSKKKIAERMKYINLEEVEEQTKGQNWICAMAHYGSWEYTINFAIQTKHDEVLAVYRPLANKGFDKYFNKTRSRFGTRPVPMNNIVREILECKKNNKAVAVALIADQTPPKNDSHEWFKFMNQDTQFFMGMEKMALKLKMPIYFLDINKLKRGYYQAKFELIYDGQQDVKPYEITKRYAHRLETMIRRRPELWMWSHRRWKHHPSK